MPIPYDVVYHWTPQPGPEKGRWDTIPCGDAQAVEAALTCAEVRLGHVAHRGLRSIGAPEGEPTQGERSFAYERSQKALHQAFDLVAPQGDWKGRIDAQVSLSAIEAVGGLVVIEWAVGHFTATHAATLAGAGGYRIVADGYHAGPAGAC